MFHLQSLVPTVDRRTCMQFCPPRARDCIYERVYDGGLHAPQSDLDSLSSPPLHHHFFSHSASCSAGNLLTVTCSSELWCCPRRNNTHTQTRHTETRQVHVGMDHTAPRVLSLVPPFLNETVRDFYSVSIFFIEVVSNCFSLQNIKRM